MFKPKSHWLLNIKVVNHQHKYKDQKWRGVENCYEAVDFVKTFYLSHNIISFHVQVTLGFRQGDLAGVGFNYFDNPCTFAIVLLHLYFCDPGKNCHRGLPNPWSDLWTLTFQIIDMCNIVLSYIQYKLKD